MSKVNEEQAQKSQAGVTDLGNGYERESRDSGCYVVVRRNAKERKSHYSRN